MQLKPHVKLQRAKVVVDDAGVKRLTVCVNHAARRNILPKGQTVCGECKSHGGKIRVKRKTQIKILNLICRAPQPMSKRYWLIRGHDGFKTIFEMKVSLGQFTADQIQDLLKALTAKMGLTCEEIVRAYAKRGTKIATDHLAVHHDFPTYMCGFTPVFTASIVDGSGKIIPKPKLS